MANSKNNSPKSTPKIVSIILSVVVLIYAAFMAPEMLPKLIANLTGESATTVNNSNKTDGNLAVHVIDIGQGDSTLIVGPQKVVLIDAGENDKGKIVVDYIKKLGITKIDLVVATHTHSDHMGGLDVVIDNFPVDSIFTPQIPDSLIPTTKTFKDFLTSVEKSKAKAITITKPQEISLGGGAKITIFPTNIVAKDVNDTSLYTTVSFGNADFLNTGDAEAISEKSILDSPYLNSIEVLALGHHGSNTSSSQEFLDKVKPTAVYISLAADNKYGHPHKEPIQRVSKMTSIINRTDLEGNIIYNTDGNIITIKSSKYDGKIDVKR